MSRPTGWTGWSRRWTLPGSGWSRTLYAGLAGHRRAGRAAGRDADHPQLPARRAAGARARAAGLPGRHHGAAPRDAGADRRACRRWPTIWPTTTCSGGWCSARAGGRAGRHGAGDHGAGGDACARCCGTSCAGRAPSARWRRCRSPPRCLQYPLVWALRWRCLCPGLAGWPGRCGAAHGSGAGLLVAWPAGASGVGGAIAARSRHRYACMRACSSRPRSGFCRCASLCRVRRAGRKLLRPPASNGAASACTGRRARSAPEATRCKRGVPRPMMKTLFLQPPSFDGFDGGAGSRYQARREIRSFWYPDLAGPAGRAGAGSKLIDAPPARHRPGRGDCRRRATTSCASSTPRRRPSPPT